MNAKHHQRRGLDLLSGCGRFRAGILPSVETSQAGVCLSEDMPKREDGDNSHASIHLVRAGWIGGRSHSRFETGQPKIPACSDCTPRSSDKTRWCVGAAPKSSAALPGRKTVCRLRKGFQSEPEKAEAEQVLRAPMRGSYASRGAAQASRGGVVIVPLAAVFIEAALEL